MFEGGWDGLHLLYEIEPANDPMPEVYLGQHFIIIALDDFRASYMLNGRWQHIDYTQGEIAIIPATQLFPQAKVDREVPLLELFLEPAKLARVVDESIDVEQFELLPQWHLRDPLIQHLGLALKAELETGGADSRLYVESMTTALSAHLLRRYSSRQQDIKSYTGGLPKYKLREVVSYIHDHLDQNLTLTEYAIAWTGLWYVSSGAYPKFDPLGILGYLFIFAMTVTSFQRPAAVLSQRGWKVLHTAGMYYFWLAFTVEFSMKIFHSVLIYLPLVILLVLAMVLRVIAPRRQRKLAS
nr:hypothetical protein [Fischerella sp. FACHB-380]